MKFLKLLFGRFSIVALLVILQVALIFSFIFVPIISQYYIYAYVISACISVVVVWRLVNRVVNPNYMLPWVVIVLVLPMFGVFLYLLFSQNRLSRKQMRWYNEMHYNSIANVPRNDEVRARLRAADKEIHGQSEYLLHASELPVFGNSRAEYLDSGEAFFERLKEDLRSAERFIFMEYFIIERGVMWDEILAILKNKVENGVEVRVMYDDIGSINTLPWGYDRKLRKMGIDCVKFNRFKPVVSAVHNNRDHRKITVIDGVIGYVGGANLADEYINAVEKFGHWKDSALRIEGAAVSSLTSMFLSNFSVSKKEKNIDFGSYFPAVYPEFKGEGYLQAFSDGPSPLYPDKVAETALLNIINEADDYCYITTPYLIVDFNFMNALKTAAKRGVDVRIITPHIPDKKLVYLMTRSSYRELIEVGVKIYEYTPGFIHAKNIISDDKVGMVSTVNLDYRSLVHHFECGVWMYDSPALQSLKSDFEATLALSHCVSYEESRLSAGKRFIRCVLQLFAPLL